MEIIEKCTASLDDLKLQLKQTPSKFVHSNEFLEDALFNFLGRALLFTDPLRLLNKFLDVKEVRSLSRKSAIKYILALIAYAKVNHSKYSRQSCNQNTLFGINDIDSFCTSFDVPVPGVRSHVCHSLLCPFCTTKYANDFCKFLQNTDLDKSLFCIFTKTFPFEEACETTDSSSMNNFRFRLARISEYLTCWFSADYTNRLIKVHMLKKQAPTRISSGWSEDTKLTSAIRNPKRSTEDECGYTISRGYGSLLATGYSQLMQTFLYNVVEALTNTLDTDSVSYLEENFKAMPVCSIEYKTTVSSSRVKPIPISK